MSGPSFDGGPAFPVLYGQTNGLNGMSLRDWFAGQFLAAAAGADAAPLDISVAADQTDIDAALMDHWSAVARAAYIAADAMLALRSKAGVSP